MQTGIIGQPKRFCPIRLTVRFTSWTEWGWTSIIFLLN